MGFWSGAVLSSVEAVACVVWCWDSLDRLNASRCVKCQHNVKVSGQGQGWGGPRLGGGSLHRAPWPLPDQRSNMDDVEFAYVPAADVPGSSLRVLGSHLHTYKPGSVHECFAVCAAADDCAAFVDHKLLGSCAFKRRGSVLTGLEHSDVYIRKQILSLPSPAPLPPMLPLVDATKHHRIALVPGFLSRHEAATLRKFAASCFHRREAQRVSAPHGEIKHMSVGTAECEAGVTAVLLSRVEERVVALTGMRAHEGEETLLFTNSSAVGRDGPWFGNVHHDKNHQEQRVATVLVYLTSQSDHEGGHTVFPTLPRDAEPHALNGTASLAGASEASSVLSSYADAVRSAYDGGRRALGCRSQTGDEGCRDEGGVVLHTAAECERALRGTQHGLAVRPTVGTALVFWSVMTDGSPDKAMWHTGCQPRATSRGRWVMQKFKSSAPADFSTCAPGEG